MFLNRWLRRLAPVLVCLVFLLTACASAPPNKYDQVQKDTTGLGKPAAVVKQAEKGGTFNQFFPKGEDDYTVVPAQEKKGFAQYKLKQNGTTLAMLSINDTVGLPAAAAKYDNATQNIAGYPAVKQGTTTLGLLVNGRYQVKVLSRDPSFTETEQTKWLQRFDLDGLAKLEAAVPQAKQLPSAQKKSPQRSAPNLVPQPAA